MARTWLVGAVVASMLVGCSGGGGDEGGGVNHTLTVTIAGTGAGTVTSSPPGISCTSGTCSASFAQGTVVNLTAAPSGGSVLAGWGVACSGTGGCTVTMGVDMSVTATFDAVPVVHHSLSVTIAGSGSGTVTSSPSGISCSSGTCSASFAEGTLVTLTATPAGGGSTFAGWAGACSGAGTGACTLTLSTDTSATATFDPPTVMRTLTVTIGGNGTGSVASMPGGINCIVSTCSSTFAEGTTVTLTATPGAGGSVFTGWVGACSGETTNTCSLTLTGDAATTAVFTQKRTLSVAMQMDGTGTVTSVPAGIDCTSGSTAGCSADFDQGTSVTLTATTAPGTTFVGWGDPCWGTVTPCTVTLTSNDWTLTADFSLWKIHRPFPTSVTGVAALGSTLIAVGAAGSVVTSPDGFAWTGHELSTAATLRGIAAGSGTAVAVGDAVGGQATILTTTDGADWTPRASTTSAALAAVAHGGGAFVAVGAGGAIVSSADGATWFTRTSNTPYDLLSAAYGSSRFVAVGYGGTVLTSPDGQTWTGLTSPPTTQYLTGVAYDASSGFVAVGNAGAVLTSSDGSAWTLQGSSIPVGGSAVVRGVAAHSGSFVALDSSHGVHVSTTGGTTWTTYAGADDLDGSGGVGIAAAGASFFAMADAGISRSPGGVSWSRVLTLGANLYGMAYGASTYVLVGHGAIFTSPDGAVWTSRFAGNPYARATDMVSSVIYGNGMFIAVSGHGILASTDGASWTAVGPAPDQYGGVVAYGAGQGFVIASANGTAARIWTSPDGTTWTEQTEAGITWPLFGITYGASTFVAVGGWNSSAIYTNPTPGTTLAWTPQSSPTSDILGNVLFGNSTFVASDWQTGQDSLTSTNAVGWTMHHAPSWMGKLVAFGDGVFLSQTLLTSSNGEAWTPMAFPPPGFTYAYAGTHDGPDGWVLATTAAGYAFAVHP